MQRYILWLDRPEKFECSVDVKGATTRNSVARLIAETKDLSIIFNGAIENGKCIIPIHKLVGLFNEKTTGNIKLEIIVENTYFTPWTSEFVVEAEKSVNVKIDDNSLPHTPLLEISNIQTSLKKASGKIEVKRGSVKLVDKKKISEVKVIDPKENKFDAPQTELAYRLLLNGINGRNVNSKLKLAENIFSRFFTRNKKYQKTRNTIIKETLQTIKSEK